MRTLHVSTSVHQEPVPGSYVHSCMDACMHECIIECMHACMYMYSVFVHALFAMQAY